MVALSCVHQHPAVHYLSIHFPVIFWSIWGICVWWAVGFRHDQWIEINNTVPPLLYYTPPPTPTSPMTLHHYRRLLIATTWVITVVIYCVSGKLLDRHLQNSWFPKLPHPSSARLYKIWSPIDQVNKVSKPPWKQSTNRKLCSLNKHATHFFVIWQRFGNNLQFQWIPDTKYMIWQSRSVLLIDSLLLCLLYRWMASGHIATGQPHSLHVKCGDGLTTCISLMNNHLSHAPTLTWQRGQSQKRRVTVLQYNK